MRKVLSVELKSYSILSKQFLIGKNNHLLELIYKKMKSKETISMMSYSLNNNLSFQIDNSTSGNNQMSCWNYWTEYYYPEVIHYSYPVYIQERAKDKGKKAYEVVKVLRDKKVIKLEKVSDFIKLMDALIEIL